MHFDLKIMSMLHVVQGCRNSTHFKLDRRVDLRVMSNTEILFLCCHLRQEASTIQGQEMYGSLRYSAL